VFLVGASQTKGRAESGTHIPEAPHSVWYARQPVKRHALTSSGPRYATGRHRTPPGIPDCAPHKDGSGVSPIAGSAAFATASVLL